MTGALGSAPITLALTESQYNELITWLDDGDETAGIVLFRATEVPGDSAVTITVREVRRIAPEHYRERGPEGLTIESTGWMPGLAAASRRGDLFGFAHTHPGPTAEPWPSDRDRAVDAALRSAADIRLPDGRYVSLIVTGTPANPQIAGALHTTDGSRPITRVRIVGDRLRLLRAPVAPKEAAADRDTSAEIHADQPGVFDRQVRAFGRDGQALLEELRVAVVGTGGTGSAVAVLLARLGVGHLTLADP